MNKYLQVSLAIILSTGLATNSFAVGSAFIANEVPSARAAGQGYVGVAGQNDDPTVVYSNPAGMTTLKGSQLTLGAHLENIHGSFQDSAGNETKERVTTVAVPNMSVTQSFLNSKLAAGLSVQSPYGLETHWDSNSPMGLVATNSRLDMVEVTPAVAYQVHPMVSIGAGIDYVNLFNTQLDRQINVDAVSVALGGAPTGAPEAAASLRGQAADWGYHAGLVFKPAEQHAIGITYHSQVDLRVKGNITINGMSPTSQMAAVFGGTSYTTSAYTDLVLPENIQFGYAFKPSDKLMLEADAGWYHWSAGRDINIRYAETNPFRLAVLNTGNPQSLTPRDAWSFATGANYKVTDRWQARAGFWYEPWAIPEANFSPAFMDLSRYGLSIGGGYGITENLTVDAAYTAVFMHNRTINNNVGLNTTGIPGYSIDGTYSDFANLFALNITYRFGGAGK